MWCGVRASGVCSADNDLETLDALEVNEAIARLAVLYGPRYVPCGCLLLADDFFSRDFRLALRQKLGRLCW